MNLSHSKYVGINSVKIFYPQTDHGSLDIRWVHNITNTFYRYLNELYLWKFHEFLIFQTLAFLYKIITRKE